MKSEAVTRRYLLKKGTLIKFRKFTEKQLRLRVFFLQKEIHSRCELCQIFQNNHSIRTLSNGYFCEAANSPLHVFAETST